MSVDRRRIRASGVRGPAQVLRDRASALLRYRPSTSRPHLGAFVPLDFLKRRGGGEGQSGRPAPPPTGSAALPEEVVAAEYQLKLYYAGKSSEGVRMKAGPNAMAE